MGFLFPGFLLGALAVTVPLYLHLLRREAADPQDFSSLMFFEPKIQSAVRHRRLRYWLLLALRLIFILLLALAFAGPYIERAAGAAPDKLLVLVIDDSFSMRAGAHLAQAKRAALEVLGAKRVRDRAQVLSFGARLQVMTPATQDVATLRAALAAIQPTDSHGSFAALAGTLRSLGESERVPIELHLFSDMQRTALATDLAEMALPRNVALMPHQVGPGAEPNWAVESVTAPARVWNPRTTRISAVIRGYATPAATRTVSLLIDDKIAATQRLLVPASGRAIAVFDSPDVPYGFNRCSVRIDGADVLPADDRFLFTLERADPSRALLVRQGADARSALYFASAVSSVAGTAVNLDQLTAEQTVGTDPSPYAFVVVSDTAALPRAFVDRLRQYVEGGGSLFIALGTLAAQQREIPVFGGAVSGARFFSRDPPGYATVGQVDAGYLPAGTDRSWTGVKFYYAATVAAPPGARVTARLGDETPLLLEKSMGEGRVVLFASGLDAVTNDLPLHPAFVAFVDRMLQYLTGAAERTGPRVVDDFVALRAAKERAVGVEIVDPQGRRPLSLSAAASADSYQMTQAGFFELRSANGRREVIAVNPDRTESDLTPIPADVLALWRGRGATAPGEPPSAAVRADVSVPYGLWWYAMLLLLAAALAESFVGSRYLGTLREQP
jgi:hypothetical protein